MAPVRPSTPAKTTVSASASCDRDPCVVPTDGVAEVIAEFVARYEKVEGTTSTSSHNLRTESGSFAGRDPNAVTGGLDALARRTVEVDVVDGVGVAKEKLRKLQERRYRTTELRTADLIVTAARRPMAFHDGTIGAVIPNPRAPKEVRGRCCGGASLNGSVSFDG